MNSRENNSICVYVDLNSQYEPRYVASNGSTKLSSSSIGGIAKSIVGEFGKNVVLVKSGFDVSEKSRLLDGGEFSNLLKRISDYRSPEAVPVWTMSKSTGSKRKR